MWRGLRISVLLLVLLVVAGQAWLDRFSTTRWQRTVYVGAFPVGADASTATARYLAQLDQRKIDEVSDFLKAEARRYGVSADEPIELKLYPTLTVPPPELDSGSGVFTRILWSLKLRYYRSRALAAVSRSRPKIALFLLYHDPELTQSLPHSAGLQRGLTAVVHVFASRSQEAQNRIVITHELLHTFGATDKYDLATGLPQYPEGFAEPQLAPRYPQQLAEIMAGRMPLSASEARLPDSLEDERVGPMTAREIGWVSH
ncbi:MAG TPA: hypothetical protein VNZ06_02905 [Steroidobacteraceae bacterium]|jgi:hypothetical protein|nr:hypothetical protein [Steroidobacteraceae bacterium]